MRRLLAIALLAVPLGAAPPRERAVVATPADESSPAAAPGWIAWTRGSTQGPVIVLSLGRVWLRRDGQRPRPVGPPGVLAAAGGGDTRTLVVQQVRGGSSELKLVDIASGRLRDPPSGVDTRAWEWRGEISGRWLLFGRVDFAGPTYRVILRDGATGRERAVAAVGGHGAYAEPGQLNGRYAVWSACPDNACSIYRLRLGSRRPIRIPATLYGTSAYAASVSRTGVVYYATGLPGCGRQVRIMRFAPGRPPRAILSLSAGYDLRFTTALDRPGGTQVLYDRVRCSTRRSDIYAVENPLATPPAVSPPSTGSTAPVR